MDAVGTDDAAVRMDRMYRHQRHVYDLTRKFYLLGRDRLVNRLAPPRGGLVAEIGCGTGRNLIALARRYPEVRLYGLDPSAAMLETARANIRRAGLDDRIALAQGIGESLDPFAMFGLARGFDAIVVSYALSMIPSWPAVIDRAIDAMAPSGQLAIVDFWDQRELPSWFARLLTRWLGLFDVHPRHELPDFMTRLAAGRSGTVAIQPVLRRYAFHIVYRNASAG